MYARLGKIELFLQKTIALTLKSVRHALFRRLVQMLEKA
jgi:hypothetical protein